MSTVRQLCWKSWFPPGLENLERWETIFQSGKSQGILPKILENQEILTLENGNKYGKSLGNLAVRKIKTMEIWCYTLNEK